MHLITGLVISLIGLFIYSMDVFCRIINQHTFINQAESDIKWYKTHEDKWLPFINAYADGCTMEALGNGEYIITRKNGEKVIGSLGMYEDRTEHVQKAGIVTKTNRPILNNRALWDAECRCIRYNGDWNKYEKWLTSFFTCNKHFYR